MPTFQARMRVTYIEEWCVDAYSVQEARDKIAQHDDDVESEDPAPERVDWEISSIKMEPSE